MTAFKYPWPVPQPPMTKSARLQLKHQGGHQAGMDVEQAGRFAAGGVAQVENLMAAAFQGAAGCPHSGQQR